MIIRTAGYLADKCISKILSWKDATSSIDCRKINSTSSLKYAIVNDPLIHIDILSPTSFRIYEKGSLGEKNCGSIISEALISDFIIGSGRVKAQYQNLMNAKASGINAAWLLVTAYYCSFFSSIEISRIFGRFSLHLEKSEILDALKRASVLQGGDQFFDKLPRSFTGYFNGDHIVFTSSGDRPHQAAWSNLGLVLNGIFKDRGWIDAQSLSLIVTGQKTPDPSTIRNEWNYRYAERFGSDGQRIGSKFLKLLGNEKGVSSWLSNTEWLKQGDEAVAASVAVLCEVVSSSVIETRSRIFNANLLEDERS